MIGLADFSQGFGGKPNERARSKRAPAAARSEQLAQHASSAWKNVDKRRAQFSLIESHGGPRAYRAGEIERGREKERARARRVNRGSRSSRAGSDPSTTGSIDGTPRRETHPRQVDPLYRPSVAGRRGVATLGRSGHSTHGDTPDEHVPAGPIVDGHRSECRGVETGPLDSRRSFRIARTRSCTNHREMQFSN
ncbi:PREDICTED: uncharacterized protein LOC105567106 isoform X1 [Vollenhovia emeryi]|uniref:uncharacterized protein LOC105567106 isoform X1 n=1 Tax=Vollenhovia emeryi TaxID=411798 RepID=UPI0005F51726|nr:PREDICTED: uncharacterized protein LOC105567106 isoform X1 [Vollenhovia emeryi]